MGRFQVVVFNKDKTPAFPTKDRFFPTKKKAEVYRRAMLEAGYRADVWDTVGNALSQLFKI